jgi:uncharacterized repeat protein (TIGR01451 family)
MTFITKQAGLLRSARRWAARALVLTLLGSLSTLAGVSSFTGGATSLALQGPLPQAYFNQSLTPPDVPPEVLIGETFIFNVRFKNIGSAVGFGPFIDLAINFRGADNNTASGLCDGIDFVNAQMVDINSGSLALTSTKYGNTNPASCPASSALHPYAGVGTVTFPTGWQLVTIELPFGSFDPSQPEIVVEVAAKVHDFADVNQPLAICTRGGFRFGTSATGGTPITEQGNDVINNNWECQEVTPTVFTLKKEYLGPEDETATGPNFKHKYKITVDIADGQTVGKPLTVTDCLPNNMAYEGGLVVTKPSTWPSYSATQPPIGTVNNPTASCLVVSWPNVFVTGVPGPDATVQFEFTIRDVDANGNEVLPNCSAPALSINPLTVTGKWSPKDPRDTGGTVTGSTSNAHQLNDKCLAIQKSVNVYQDTGAPGPTPGDILKYTLSFQISDYKTIGQIKITDRLSDGQLFLNSPPPMLTIGDQFGSYTINPLPSTYYSATGDPHSQVKKCPVKGTTNLVFDVSAALTAAATPSGHPRHLAGILTGGLAAAPPSTTPAVGTLVFYARIRDDFSNAQSPGNKFVDKHDPLCNEVEIQGTVYKNETDPKTVPSSVIGNVRDDSRSQISIVTDFLKKSVYQVKDSAGNVVCGPSPACPAPPDVRPGDQVTFRITYTVPSSDAENLTIQDWLPLPIFDVKAPDGVTPGTTPSYGWTPFNAAIPLCVGGGTAPPAGGVCRLGTDTLTAFVTPPPTLSNVDGTTNSLTFTYGTSPNWVNDSTNTPRTIDLVFTIVVNAKPFADGLFLTNEARECEKNTFDVTFCQVAVAQVHVREPKLGIRKGIIATDNPHGQFSQPASPPGTTAQAPAGVTWINSPGGPNPRFTGVINSTNLDGWINSDLTGVDANDRITFAIVIENQGGHPAFDVKLEDIIPVNPATGDPSCFKIDFNSIHVADGTAMTFTPAPTITQTSGGGFTIAFPGASPIPAFDPLNPANGKNIVVITFDATLIKDIKPGCCENVAKLENYASQPNGPNFVSAGFGGPFVDTAKVCVKPEATKSIKTTSEAHTPGTPSGPSQSPEQLAIGEIVRYRLEVVVPETSAPTLYKLQDFLPVGLSFLPGSETATLISDSGLSVSNPQPVVSGGPFTCSGADPIFDFGTVTNTDNDSDQEFIVLEFNALVCNIPSNLNGTPLNNSFGVFVDGQQVATSNIVQAVVVEPKLTLTKTANPTSVGPGGTVTYTVTITNTGTATAFDVVFTDTLPAGLTLAGPPTATCASPIIGAGINVTCPQVPVAPAQGSTVTITYQATVSPTAQCNTTLTNSAKVTWTSLPGPKGTVNNPTGSSTVGNSGAIDGERDGSDGLLNSGVLNDYQVQASATITVVCVCDLAIKKTVDPQSACSWAAVRFYCHSHQRGQRTLCADHDRHG